jgi:autotransporter-associated beta strand protein
VSSTAVAELLSESGITISQNITVVSNVNSTPPVQAGAVLGGAPGQTSSTWTGNIILNQPTSFTAGGSGTVTFTGNISDGVGGNTSTGVVYNFISSNVTKVDAGTVIFAGTNTYSGSTNVSAGSLVLSGPGALPANNNLSIASGASVQIAAHNGGNSNIVVATPNQLTLAGSQAAGWGGLVDITNNDLVITSGSLPVITNQVQSGYNGGAWNGSNGITSSSAAADTTYLTAVGVLLNNDGLGNTIYGTPTGTGTNLGLFDGTSPALNAVLVKYTYYGDSNLDGGVDGSDYTNIDNGYDNQLTGWQNGDFNYDSVVDGSDYTLIDNAYNMQQGSLGSNPAEQIAAATLQIASPIADGSTAVPEPASLAITGLAGLALLGRRRRKSLLNRDIPSSPTSAAFFHC